MAYPNLASTLFVEVSYHLPKPLSPIHNDIDTDKCRAREEGNERVDQNQDDHRSSQLRLPAHKITCFAIRAFAHSKEGIPLSATGGRDPAGSRRVRGGVSVVHRVVNN